MAEEAKAHKTFMAISTNAEVSADSKIADDAMRVADVTELYRLYHKRVNDLDTMAKGFDALVSHYAGKVNEPRRDLIPSADAIQSMERVAIAAIELAKIVAENPPESRKK